MAIGAQFSSHNVINKSMDDTYVYSLGFKELYKLGVSNGGLAGAYLGNYRGSMSNHVATLDYSQGGISILFARSR